MERQDKLKFSDHSNIASRNSVFFVSVIHPWVHAQNPMEAEALKALGRCINARFKFQILIELLFHLQTE